MKNKRGGCSMSKKFFKVLACAVIVVMVLSLFAACGSKAPESKEGSAETAKTEPSKADAAKTEPGKSEEAKTEEKGSVSALIWIPDAPDAMQQIMDEFMKANPNIKVDLQLMTGSSVEENVQPKAAANNMPDLLSLNANAFAAALADEGKIADISETESWKNVIESLQAEWTSPGGKHFGISGGLATTLIYYNLAMKVLDYMCGEGFHIYQNKRQCVPPFKETKGEVKLAPEIVNFVKDLSSYPVAGGLYFAVLPANCVDLSHKLMQEVLIGQKTPEQAAEALDKAAKEGVKK